VPPYNAARTLLTTGIADASLRSVAAGNARCTPPLASWSSLRPGLFVLLTLTLRRTCCSIETPSLHVAYESFDDDKPPIRPHNPRPTGPTEDLDAPDDNWSSGSSRWQSAWGKPIPQ